MEKKICKKCGKSRVFIDKYGICIICKKGHFKGIEKTHRPIFSNAKTRKSVDLTPENSKKIIEKKEGSKIFFK